MRNHALAVVALLGLISLVSCGGGYQSPTITPPPALAIASAAPPSGTVGAPYAGSGFSLTASGGIAPYSWSWTAASGSTLPAGLNLSASGLISGTPQVAVAYGVTVTVTDSAPKPAQVSVDYQIIVADVLTITSGAPPSGTVGVDYGPTIIVHWYCYRYGPVVLCRYCSYLDKCSSLPRCQGNIQPLPCTKTSSVFQGFTFAAAGGIAPYTWSASGMPPGIDVDPSTGKILGTPTMAGSYSMLVTVTDSASPPVQTSGTYVIDIN